MRFLPNLITLLRILLIVPFLGQLHQADYGLALLLFVVAGLSDGIDGFLARHFGWTSRLGAILDPMADKLLMLSAYLALGILQVLPWWLVGLVLLRDAVIVSGALAYHLRFGVYEMAPLLASKVNTACQILLIVLSLFALWQGGIPPVWLEGLGYLVALTTLISGTVYVWVWSHRALIQRRGT